MNPGFGTHREVGEAPPGVLVGPVPPAPDVSLSMLEYATPRPGRAVRKGSGCRSLPAVGRCWLLRCAVLQPAAAMHDADVPRIAMYSSWNGTQEIGWVRFTFDKFGIPYDLIYKERVKKGNLRNDYDVILMDMNMPIMDGYEATRAIRAWEQKQDLPKTQIIALTALVLKEEGEKILEAGCNAHMTKPIKRQTLLEVLQACEGYRRQ